MAPKDEAELRNMVYSAVQYKNHPVAIRYPRGAGIGVEISEEFKELEVGKGEIISKGKSIAMLTVGLMVDYSAKAIEILKNEEIDPTLVNMRFIKPLDTDLLDQLVKEHDVIVTLEESSLVGGFGSAVLEYFAEKGYKNSVLRIGLPDSFVEHGTQAQLHEILEIDPKGIAKKIKQFVINNEFVAEVNE